MSELQQTNHSLAKTFPEITCTPDIANYLEESAKRIDKLGLKLKLHPDNSISYVLADRHVEQQIDSVDSSIETNTCSIRLNAHWYTVNFECIKDVAMQPDAVDLALEILGFKDVILAAGRDEDTGYYASYTLSTAKATVGFDLHPEPDLSKSNF